MHARSSSHRTRPSAISRRATGFNSKVWPVSSPDQEPDPARLGELAQLARDQGVTTIFTEETVSPRIADTLAREAGGLRTEVLSPLESLTNKERAAKADYFTLMESNLDKIGAALGCPSRS